MRARTAICVSLLIAILVLHADAGPPAFIYGQVSQSSDGYAAAKGVGVNPSGFAVAYKVAMPADRADSRNTETQMYNGYFHYDAGSLWKNWSAGDDAVVVIEVSNADSGGHGAYVASTDKAKTLADPDVFPTCILEKIPTPVFNSSGNAHIMLEWAGLGDANGNVEGFNVYRSTELGSTPTSLAGTAPLASGKMVYFADTGLSGGPFYYKIKVKFRGGYESEGVSEKSAQMSLGGGAVLKPTVTQKAGAVEFPGQALLYIVLGIVVIVFAVFGNKKLLPKLRIAVWKLKVKKER